MIAKPYKDKEGGPKLDSIQQWLNERDMYNEYIPGIGKIVNQIDNPRIILVSHIDLIRKFQKGFAEGNTHEIITSKKGNEIIKGALDNTITNAVAMLAFEKIIQEEIFDIELVLTEGEEVGCIGMDNYLKEFPEKAQNAFFINLDVTNEGWKQHSSVEYDKPSFNMLKQLQELLKEHDAFFTGDRVGDDIDAVNEHKCSGLSYCLPTKDLIHSYENKAYVHTLEGYYYGLLSLLRNLEVLEDRKELFSKWIFDDALKVSTKEEFEALKPKKSGYQSDYSRDRDNTRYQKQQRSSTFIEDDFLPFDRDKKEPKKVVVTDAILFQRQEMASAITDYVVANGNYSKSQIAEIGGFFEMVILADEEFFAADLALCFKDSKTPLKTAFKIIEEFIDFGSIEEIGTDRYKFSRAEEVDF